MADHQPLDGSLAEGSADRYPGYEFFLFVALVSEVFIQFLGSVGIGMSDIESVVLVWRAYLEDELVVHSP